MRRLVEETRKHIDVSEVGNVWRQSDGCLYTLYKSVDGIYYIDAYDAAPSITKFGDWYKSDAEALAAAQRYIDREEAETWSALT